MEQHIYADHAATTPLSKTAYEKMKPWLEARYGNPSTLYSLAREPRKAVKAARETIAACIGAAPEEIYFTSGGTESDNWAIKGSAFSDPRKRATITSQFEHHAVLHSCASIERLGYPVAYLPPTREGYLQPQTFREIITENTRLVSVMTVNNEIGTIQPIPELSEIAHANGALFHTDAVQAVGHIPINVRALGVDMLSASAHKFNGPKGTGFLYIRKGVQIAPLIDGGGQEGKMRAGTENVAGIVGMAAALEENCKALADHEKHISRLEQLFLTTLKDNGTDFSLNGGTERIPGILSIAFPGAEGEVLLHRLDLMGICVSTGSACNSRDTEISHVLQAIRLEENLALGTIRISLGWENTEDEVRKIADALRKITNR